MTQQEKQVSQQSYGYATAVPVVTLEIQKGGSVFTFYLFHALLAG
jgi:hypothetical protein